MARPANPLPLIETDGIDIADCDREPIHTPGSIQPHGLLLVVDPASERVLGAAGPFLRLLGFGDDPLGRPLWDVLGMDLRALLAGNDLATVSEPVFVGSLPARDGRRELDILGHARAGRLLLEIEPALADRPSASRLFARMREAADRMRACDDRMAAFAAAADEVRAASGFDRVLVYRFLGDASGEVVGEARAESVRSFMGHRFPAGDVPQQARALYIRSVIRVIPDAGYEPAPLRGVDRALDMSDCSLRSVSPVHAQYLRNMGVAASMSVSLIRDGALWGLIACHNETPRLVPYETREACKHIAAELMRRLAAFDEAEEAESHRRLTRDVDHLTARIAARADIAGGISEVLGEIAARFDADGAVLRAQAASHVAGPLAAGIDAEALLGALDGAYGAGVFATDDVAHEDAAGLWCQGLDGGLLFVASDGTEPIALALLRRRVPEDVSWAGNPAKSVERDAATGRLGPRRSFEVWRQTQRGLPLPWSPVERDAAARLATQIERLVRQQRIAMLQAELIHVSRVSAMGALASTLAHELNQPLTAIANFGRGVSHLLTQDREQGIDRALGYLDQMSHAAVRAGQVVKRLRAMVGKAPVQRDEVFVAEVIADALSLALPDAHVRGIAIEIAVAPGAERVLGDTVQIEQVLTNLVRNAAEAMAGSRDRRLAIAAVPAGAGLIELRVHDTGPGVAADVRAQLFAPFSTSKIDGMGLGLSICRTIVERHGGKIWLDETAGPGSLFRFTLPAAPKALA